MKRAVSGLGVIIVRVAAAITLDDRGTQLPLSLKGVPDSRRNGSCFALSALDSEGVIARFLSLSAIFSR